jgi:hypothetical protein
VYAKVDEFFDEIVSHTLDLAYHENGRFGAVPYDVARALRVFAENGYANFSGPKFVVDCSRSDDDPDDDDWEDSDDEDEQEDISVTDSMQQEFNDVYDDEEDTVYIGEDKYLTYKSDDEAFIGENKYQQDNLISIFHDKYPPVNIEKLTDEQFRTQVLFPLFKRYTILKMGFTLEDYAPLYSNLIPQKKRDASAVIGMLKRGMYAFVVASIREDFEQEAISIDRELEKKAAKEEEMQAQIDFLQEQLKKPIPETVKSTNYYTQLSQSEEGEEAGELQNEEAEEQPPSKRQHTESGIGQGSRPKTRSTTRQVPVKQENMKDGLVECPDPDCGNIICLSERGCKLVVCKKHMPHFLYFCAHCKIRQEPFAETLECDCPGRNTPEDRERAQEMRNKRARENPIDVE